MDRPGSLWQQFPRLFSYSRRKNRSVRVALCDDTWIRDLARGNNHHLLADVLALHRVLQGAEAQLQPGVPDGLIWSRASSGKYTAKSAYLVQFQGRTTTQYDRLLWKAWAPGKIKIFAWLLLQDRLWCNDRLQRRGWTNAYFCQLCVSRQKPGVIAPPLLELPGIRTGLDRAGAVARLFRSHPGGPAESWRHDSTITIVQSILEQTPHQWRKGVRTLCLLACWEIWQERNHCTFRQHLPCVARIIKRIRDSIELWRSTGAACIESPFGDPP